MEEKNKWEQKGHESEHVVALIKLPSELQVWLELLDLFTSDIKKKNEKPIKHPQFFISGVLEKDMPEKEMYE